MKLRIAVILSMSLLAGCASRSLDVSSNSPQKAVDKAQVPASQTSSQARTLDAYKREVASRISRLNANNVYLDNPQAELRAVIVVHYVVSADGRLVKAEIMRSNKDMYAENTALACLQNSAPFPRPSPLLLSGGRVEISETWLFNDDGRFQLRSVALPQQSE